MEINQIFHFAKQFITLLKSSIFLKTKPQNWKICSNILENWAVTVRFGSIWLRFLNRKKQNQNQTEGNFTKIQYEMSHRESQLWNGSMRWLFGQQLLISEKNIRSSISRIEFGPNSSNSTINVNLFKWNQWWKPKKEEEK